MSLRELRKSRGLTQEEMAKILNMSFRTYQSYETGATSPTLDRAVGMADMLGCSISEMFDVDGVIGVDLSQEERRLLLDYRALTPEGRTMAASLMRYMELVEARARRR